nr:putative receptor-like protein kinase [Ipomoea batatas]
MWQGCASCLPTSDLLRAKMVNCNPICPMCQYADESIFHLLAHCPYATQCWNLSNLHVSPTGVNSIGDWLTRNTKLLDASGCCLLLMVCWYIWYARNEKIWNNRRGRRMRGETKLDDMDSWRERQREGGIAKKSEKDELGAKDYEGRRTGQTEAERMLRVRDC